MERLEGTSKSSHGQGHLPPEDFFWASLGDLLDKLNHLPAPVKMLVASNWWGWERGTGDRRGAGCRGDKFWPGCLLSAASTELKSLLTAAL